MATYDPTTGMNTLDTVSTTVKKLSKLGAFMGSFNSDVARPSKFDVTIIAPAMIQKYSNTLRQLTLRCETAELPGRTFGTVEQKFGSNPTLKFPMHSSYNDLTLTFIVSGDMTERTFFDVWMEYINPTKTFDFAYKDDFTSTIEIVQYNLFDEETYVVNLFNAYPVSVNQLDLDWSSDSHHKLTVVFAYDYWQNADIQTLGEIQANRTITQSFQNGSDKLFGATILSSSIRPTVPTQAPSAAAGFDQFGNQTRPNEGP